jgi:hypothetical protein
VHQLTAFDFEVISKSGHLLKGDDSGDLLSRYFGGFQAKNWPCAGHFQAKCLINVRKIIVNSATLGAGFQTKHQEEPNSPFQGIELSEPLSGSIKSG